jgi:hypothetical protein
MAAEKLAHIPSDSTELRATDPFDFGKLGFEILVVNVAGGLRQRRAGKGEKCPLRAQSCQRNAVIPS